MKRASISISLNIAEGHGRWHKNDKKQFFYIARGSAYECVPLVRICVRNNLISSADGENLLNHITRINQTIAGLIRKENKKIN